MNLARVSLTAGAILGAPFGVLALAWLPANIMRLLIGGVLLAAVLLLWRGYKFERTPPTGAQIGLGLFSGLLNGSTAMGGPPVILYFLAAPDGVAIGPILMGISKPVHILTTSATPRRVINMTAIAAVDAQIRLQREAERNGPG